MSDIPYYDNAGILYDVYCRAVGGKAFNNEPLPNWKEFASDPKKRKQVNGWIAIAKFAIENWSEP